MASRAAGITLPAGPAEPDLLSLGRLLVAVVVDIPDLDMSFVNICETPIPSSPAVRVARA
ncbi:hypothetical protein MSHI_37340 [Mycobacterium shinjukuense]|uniref:Uncharacterized protein n=1 Tax=Mycobacterium shinjukuense TaxID=398694 RepID=A0A7I7MU71_9MYCO|nr:hypothetical protein MSHI_37340 [Mycobacterium shinjukuense]